MPIHGLKISNWLIGHWSLVNWILVNLCIIENSPQCIGLITK